MAGISTVRGGIEAKGTQPVSSGSQQSNWVTLNGDLTQTNATATLYPTISTSESNLVGLPIPPGCTRVLIRARALVAATLPGTSAVVKLYVADDSASSGGVPNTPGVPTRIDASTADAVGVTVLLANNSAQDGTYKYGDPTTLTGYDCLGGSYLYGVVTTASSYAAVLQALFLN